MQPQQRKKVRVWVDGCFDVFHFGHANFLRKAKALGDELVVGVHSDKEIEKNKGPPVMKEDIRYALVRACKFVDEVVEDAPYNTQVEWLDRYHCDFCVHGDDLVLDGSGIDTYAHVKAVGRFQTVPRTTGVSTTDIVGRLLTITQPTTEPIQVPSDSPSASAPVRRSPYTGVSRYLPSCTRIAQFAVGARVPGPRERVVYVDGGWDLFHLGHARFLEEAHKLGDYLIVGVYPDQVVRDHCGAGLPVMNVHERVLSVLACRYADEVLIGTPRDLGEEILKGLHVDLVVHGSRYPPHWNASTDPYAVAKKLGLFREIPSPTDYTLGTVIYQIVQNRLLYEERNRKKEARELLSMGQ